MSIDTYPPAALSTPDAVLGYAEMTADVTGITSTITDLLTVTVFVPAGRRIRVRGEAAAQSSATGDQILYYIREGGVTIRYREYRPAVANVGEHGIVEVILTPTPGVHTYQFSLGRGFSATGTIASGGTANRQGHLIVEDITGGTGGPGPIQLGYAESRSAQTGITTEVDITGLTTTVTVAAGRQLRITGSVAMRSNTLTQGGQVRIKQDNVEIQYMPMMPVVADQSEVLQRSVIVSPTAGTHTYKLTVQRSGGSNTVSLDAYSTDPNWILVEDITGTPAPGGLLPSSQTLALAETTTTQSTITDTDLTGLTVTVALPAGRRIRVTYHEPAMVGTAASDSFSFQIREGATVLQDDVIGIAASNVFNRAVTPSVVLSPSAGIHTYVAHVVRTGGSGSISLNRGATQRAFLLVEDITGGALPVPAASVPVGVLGYSLGITDTFTTEKTLNGYSVNVVVPAGRTLKITAQGHVYSNTTAGQAAYFAVKEDGVAVGAAQRTNIINSAVSEKWVLEVIRSPAAGAHTYTVTALRNTGTDTLNNRVGSETGFLLVEDITPTPVPAITAPSSTLAYAELTGSSATATTTAVDTGLTVTVTVGVGRRVRLSAMVPINSTVANDMVQARLQEDTTVLAVGQVPVTATSTAAVVPVSAVVSPSAASHTYKVTFLRGSGTGTAGLQGISAAAPAYILVEDITGVAISSEIGGLYAGFATGGAAVNHDVTTVDTWQDGGATITIPNPVRSVTVTAVWAGYGNNFTAIAFSKTRVGISFDGGSSYTTGTENEAVFGQGGSNYNRGNLTTTHFRTGLPTGDIKIRLQGYSAHVDTAMGGTMIYMMMPT
jgi:hypothetical protein